MWTKELAAVGWIELDTVVGIADSEVDMVDMGVDIAVDIGADIEVGVEARLTHVVSPCPY